MVIDKVKRHLQEHLSDGLVTIVGSGLSCSEGLPGMGELADHLSTVMESRLSGDDLSLWKELVPLIATKGLEAALLVKAPTISLESVISTVIGSFIESKEREVITDVFKNKRVLGFTRLVRHFLKPSSGIPIITTNYDRLVEVAVEEAEIGVDNMFVGKFAATLNPRESQLSFCRNVTYRNRHARFEYKPRALVYKPHGSLDWYYRSGNPVAYSGDLCDIPRLIITPGRNKFRNGYESPFDHHRNKANEAIDNALRFLIIGYGFNDDHLETHLTPAINSGKPTVMLARTLSANALTVALNNPNMTSLDAYEEKGKIGTRLIMNKESHFLPNLKLWDIRHFVDEVLEP